MMKSTIGWIGAGKMGSPMVTNLLAAGYTTYLYGRSERSLLPLIKQGAQTASSPKDLLEAVDILFLMVPDDAAVDSLFMSADGILAGNLKGKIIVNMSTVSPAISRKMAVLCGEEGAAYLDIPVSGSVKQAEDATLIMMAGGDRSVYETIKPVLMVLGSASIYIGNNGAGSTMKLVINMLLAIQAQALSEVINFAQSNGIGAATVMDTINQGILGSVFVKIKGEQIVKQNYKAAFALSQMVKDLILAKKQGWNAPLGNVAFQTYLDALDQFGEEDIIAIQKYLEL